MSDIKCFLDDELTAPYSYVYQDDTGSRTTIPVHWYCKSRIIKDGTMMEMSFTNETVTITGERLHLLFKDTIQGNTFSIKPVDEKFRTQIKSSEPYISSIIVRSNEQNDELL